VSGAQRVLFCGSRLAENEHSYWSEEGSRLVRGNKAVIQFAEVSDDVIAVVRHWKPKDVTREGMKLTIDVPLSDNPGFVAALVAAGGRIQYVTQLNPALEETYLRIIQETR